MDNPEAGSTPSQAAARDGPPGSAVGPAYPGYPAPAAYRPTNGLAVAAFVIGLVGLFSCPLLGGVAVYLATRARTDIRATGEGGDSLALAGLIVGWCALAIGVLVALLWALLMAAFIAINAGHGTG
ncbi:MAG TPA: DUF4190 domain-containing protein [Micromonosporaceae bacterium]|nr:DUF4190 domain-containing protein [Micromonosporaceae bacterium]